MERRNKRAEERYITRSQESESAQGGGVCARARARHVDAEVEAHVEAIGVPMLKQLFSRGPRLIG